MGVQIWPFVLPAHHVSHEDGGSDEVSVAGLSGVLADPQKANILVTPGGDLSIGTITDGEFLKRSGGNIVSDTVSVDAPYDLLYYRKTGRFYGPSVAPYFTSSDTQSAGGSSLRFDAVPFVVPRKCTIDALACSCFDYTSSIYVRMGIYADDGTVYPGSLIAQTARITIDDTGDFSAAISATLDKGLYWLAIAAGGSGSVELYTTPRGHTTPIIGSETGRQKWGYGYRVSGTDYTGGLPATYPAGATLLTGNLGYYPYWVAARIASYP